MSVSRKRVREKPPAKKFPWLHLSVPVLIILAAALLLLLLSGRSVPAPEASSPREEAFLTDSLSFYAGEPHDLFAFVNENCRGCTFYTDNPDVLHLSPEGLLTGLSPGEAHVFVDAPGYGGTLRVSISEYPKTPGLHFEENYYRLSPGERLKPSYTCYPEKESVTLSLTGDAAKLEGEELLGVSRGAALLTASNGELSDTCLVFVTSSSPLPPLGPLPPVRYAAAEEAPAFSGRDDRAVLILGGDLMCLSAQQSAAKKGGTYDYTYVFSGIRPILAACDFAMANLETCLSYSNVCTISDKGPPTNPYCNAQATYLDALRQAGFDAVATANNHCADTGTLGLAETLSLLDDYGFLHTGTFSRAGEQRYILADINGIKVAFLSYATGMNRSLPAEYAPLCLNAYTKEKAEADIVAARAAGADYVITYIHWGTENTHEVNARQREMAQELADAGTDFIAGSHPHCLQPGGSLTASDGRQVTVVYSMGNLVSSMPRTINNDAALIRLVLVKTKEGASLLEKSYIPLRVGAVSGRRFALYPVTADSAAGRRIRAILGGTFAEQIEA